MYRTIVCAWLCFIFCTCALAQQTTPSSPNPIGTWEGTLDAGAAKLKLVLHIEGKQDGSLIGRLDSPDQGASDLPIDSISVADNTLKFEMKTLGATYEGKLDAEGNQIAGEFKQGGQAFPLTFKRTGRTATRGLLTIRKVAAGGHSLNMLVGGEGTPTIVLEAGFGTGLASWSTVQSSIAKFARTVSYDRAGIGESEAGPKPRNAKQIATELHTALQNANIGPPYVLVGHSLGGIFVRVFADLYPKEVAGLVLIDPSQEAFDEWAKSNRIRPSKDEQSELAKASQGVRDESVAVPTYFQYARSAKLPNGIPVILLTAMKDDTVSAETRKVWVEKHAEWIAKVPGGKHIKVENSGHFIQAEQPQMVIDAIREVIDLAKKR